MYMLCKIVLVSIFKGVSFVQKQNEIRNKSNIHKNFSKDEVAVGTQQEFNY